MGSLPAVVAACKANSWCVVSPPAGQHGWRIASATHHVPLGRAQFSHHFNTVLALAEFDLVELTIVDYVKAFDARKGPHYLQLGFWRGEQAGENEIGGRKDLPSRC